MVNGNSLTNIDSHRVELACVTTINNVLYLHVCERECQQFLDLLEDNITICIHLVNIMK